MNRGYLLAGQFFVREGMEAIVSNKNLHASYAV